GIQLSIRPDHVGATAGDAIFVPVPPVHERFDKKAEGMALVEFQIVQEPAERLRFTTASDEILEPVANPVAEKSLEGAEVDKVADRTDPPAHFQEVPYRRAVGIAAGQGGEIIESRDAPGLLHQSENDVRRVERRGLARPVIGA